MQLRGRTRRSGGEVVVELDGDADLATAPQLTQVLARALDDADKAGASLTVDLDGLAVVDDAALGLLVGAATNARRRSVAFSLLCTNPRRRYRLADTRIDRIVDVVSPAAAIFHVALPDDWTSAETSGVYSTSTRGRTVDDEGFVHCAFGHQLRGVAQRFYDDVDELVILRLDRAAVEADLRIEPAAEGTDELFPHVYRPIPVDAVTATSAWRRDANGWGEPPTGAAEDTVDR